MRARRLGKALRARARGHKTGGGNAQPRLWPMANARRILVYRGQNGGREPMTARQRRRLRLKMAHAKVAE